MLPARRTKTTRILRKPSRLAAAGLTVLLTTAGLIGATVPAYAAGSSLAAESFTGSSVADSNWLAFGDACLTGSNTTTTGNTLGKCAKTVQSPTIGATPGYLQLTDNSTYARGAVLYNRAIPSTAGVQVDFNTYQYGQNGTVGIGAADGIGFYLTDGAYNLTNPGPYGGSLGYSASGGTSGVNNGYLGVGLDAYGNFSSSGYGGSDCNQSYAAAPEAVVVRGAGNGTSGYCRLASTTVSTLGAFKLDATAATASAALTSSKRNVRIIVSPVTQGNPLPTVTTYIDFTGTGNSYTQVSQVIMTSAPPTTYKFGFSASTGGGSEAHLINTMAIQTVNPLGSIHLDMNVNHNAANGGTTQSSFTTGDTVPVLYTVTNGGADTITNVTVNDPNISNVNCPVTSLTAGNSEQCTGTLTVTATQAQAGSINDGATATATDSTNAAVNSTASTTIPTYQAALKVVGALNTSPGSISQPGTRTFTYTIQNSGNVTLGNITNVNTAYSGQGTLSTATCNQTSLTPGATTTCSITANITQADFDQNGSMMITDTAKATGTYNGTTVSTASTTGTLLVLSNAAVSLAMSHTSNPNPVTGAGQQISFNLLVTNTGNQTLNALNTTLNGPSNPVTVTCPVTTLAVGANTTCTATYTVTQNDIDNNQNFFDGEVQAKGGNSTSYGAYASQPQTIAYAPSSQFSVTDTTSTTAVTAAGQQLTYKYVLTNTGTTTLINPYVNNVTGNVGAQKPSYTFMCNRFTVAPGASTTCSVIYTVTQADIESGANLVYGATPHMTTQPGTPVNGAAFSTAVAVQQQPALSLTSTTVSPSTVTASGQQVTLTYAVKNTGNLILDNVGLHLPSTGSNSANGTVTPSCPTSQLVPGASENCSITYTTTQADIDQGGFEIKAQPYGIEDRNHVTEVDASTADTTINATRTPQLAVSVSADQSALTAAGQVVNYTYLVNNTGNVTLHGVNVDPTYGLVSHGGNLTVPSCPTSTLAPGDHMTCTVAYTATQNDLDAGGVSEKAQVTSGDAYAVSALSNRVDTTTTEVDGLTMADSSTTTPVDHVGQQITYTYTIVNNGNVSVDNTSVGVRNFTGTGSLSAPPCSPTTLAPGASTTCSTTYTVTQADVDNGSVSLTVRGNAHSVLSGQEIDATDQNTVTPVNQGPSLTIASNVSPASVNSANTAVTYDYLVTNTGNVTLHGVNVVTEHFTGDATAPTVTCPNATLAPGDHEVCEGVYTTDQADINNGGFSHKVHADATTQGGTAVNSVSIQDTETAVQNPQLSVVQNANASAFDHVGQQITYTTMMTNTGNVTDTNLALNSTFAGIGNIACPVTTLAPGDHTSCVVTYTVTQADLDRGTIVSKVTGTSGSGAGTVTSPVSSVTVQGTQTPALTLTQAADTTTVDHAGQVVTYTYVLTNTGNVTISNTQITNSTTGSGHLSGVTCPTATLAPGASVTCSATYTVTQADVDGGNLNATANVTANAGSNGLTIAGGGTQTTGTTVNRVAGITLTQAASATTGGKVGQQITYTFVVSNTGNVSASGLNLTSKFDGSTPLGAIDCPKDSLAPGDSFTCTATYTLTQADIDAGTLTNAATVSGVTTLGTVTAAANTTVLTDREVSLVLTEQASLGKITKAGQHVVYTFKLTNGGTTTVTQPTVVPGAFSGKGKLGKLVCEQTVSLAPGASITCTVDYTVVQADLTGKALTLGGSAWANGVTGVKVVSANTLSASTTPKPVTPVKPVAPHKPTTGNGGGTGTGNGGQLAHTGSDLLPAGAAALLLLIVGAALVISARRRRTL